MDTLTINKEAFVYCWTDFGTNKLYVGVHKGTPDDGYVCSSKLMIQEYKKRPGDFSRQIIASGLFKEMYVLETAILKAAGADKDPRYYNQHLNNGKFSMEGKTHTTESKNKISNRKIGKKITIEQSQNQSIWMIGKKNALGHKLTDVQRKEISIRMKKYANQTEQRRLRSVRMLGNQLTKGRKHSEEYKKRMSAKLTGKKRGPYKKREVN